MTQLWHLIVAHWKDWGVPTIAAALGGVFVWFFPNRKEWRQARKERAASKIDSLVLGAISDFSLWKGPRAMTGAGVPAVRASEIAQILHVDYDTVADSLERLYVQGRVNRENGTLDDPSPTWLFVPR